MMMFQSLIEKFNMAWGLVREHVLSHGTFFPSEKYCFHVAVARRSSQTKEQRTRTFVHQQRNASCLPLAKNGGRGNVCNSHG